MAVDNAWFKVALCVSNCVLVDEIVLSVEDRELSISDNELFKLTKLDFKVNT